MEVERQDERFVMDMFLQRVIDEAVFKLKMEKLLAAIDEALDNRDEKKFYELSQEYKELMDASYK
jgi:uncharacterized protein YpiB (UPF0302 family)